MRSGENYTPHITVALCLTLGILVVFQMYILREPARIEADLSADHEAVVASGRQLYSQNCAACHGDNGEGGVGPALNSHDLLTLTVDEALFSLTRTGIPGTTMPAWGQAFGGPFTDEQLSQLVAYIRTWEATAPEITSLVEAPSPARGAEIFSQTCSICHGENGLGSDDTPAVNDLQRLGRLDNAWYRNTIAHGRPAKGMPTWGTVLSPAQIDDVVALIDLWRAGETVTVARPLAAYVNSALFAIREFDAVDAEFYLNAALAVADDTQAAEIREIIDLVRENQLFVAESRVATLLPPEEMGGALFRTNCASCHGEDGTGDTGPNLHTNGFVQAQSDEGLVDFILTGRNSTPMNGFEGILTEDELRNVVLLLRSWQD